MVLTEISLGLDKNRAQKSTLSMVKIMNNRYVKRSKILEAKFRKIVKYFSLDLDAKQIANLCNLNRNTINRYLRMIRERISEYCETLSPFSVTIEVDESYFVAKRAKGKAGRGAYGKTVVFGIFKRVYTEIVSDCSMHTLQGVIRGRVSLDSVIHSDGWRGYNGLVDMGYKKHLRVDHGKDELVKGKTHINGIEGFWGFAKTRLMKFRGMSKSTFYLHLKECEFRFNHRNKNIYDLILKLCKNKTLN